MFFQKAGKKKHLGKYEILRDIVSDGDKIEAIGRQGIVRCYKYTTETYPKLEKELVSNVYLFEWFYLKAPEYTWSL